MVSNDDNCFLKEEHHSASSSSSSSYNSDAADFNKLVGILQHPREKQNQVVQVSSTRKRLFSERRPRLVRFKSPVVCSDETTTTTTSDKRNGNGVAMNCSTERAERAKKRAMHHKAVRRLAFSSTSSPVSLLSPQPPSFGNGGVGSSFMPSITRLLLQDNNQGNKEQDVVENKLVPSTTTTTIVEENISQKEEEMDLDSLSDGNHHDQSSIVHDDDDDNEEEDDDTTNIEPRNKKQKIHPTCNDVVVAPSSSSFVEQEQEQEPDAEQCFRNSGEFHQLVNGLKNYNTMKIVNDRAYSRCAMLKIVNDRTPLTAEQSWRCLENIDSQSERLKHEHVNIIGRPFGYMARPESSLAADWTNARKKFLFIHHHQQQQQQPHVEEKKNNQMFQVDDQMLLELFEIDKQFNTNTAETAIFQKLFVIKSKRQCTSVYKKLLDRHWMDYLSAIATNDTEINNDSKKNFFSWWCWTLADTATHYSDISEYLSATVLETMIFIGNSKMIKATVERARFMALEPDLFDTSQICRLWLIDGLMLAICNFWTCFNMATPERCVQPITDQMFNTTTSASCKARAYDRLRSSTFMMNRNNHLIASKNDDDDDDDDNDYDDNKNRIREKKGIIEMGIIIKAHLHCQEAPAWKICLGYMQSHPEVFADLTLDEWTAVVQSRNTLVLKTCLRFPKGVKFARCVDTCLSDDDLFYLANTCVRALVQAIKTSSRCARRSSWIRPPPKKITDVGGSKEEDEDPCEQYDACRYIPMFRKICLAPYSAPTVVGHLPRLYILCRWMKELVGWQPTLLEITNSTVQMIITGGVQQQQQQQQSVALKATDEDVAWKPVIVHPEWFFVFSIFYRYRDMHFSTDGTTLLPMMSMVSPISKTQSDKIDANMYTILAHVVKHELWTTKQWIDYLNPDGCVNAWMDECVERLRHIAEQLSHLKQQEQEQEQSS